MFVFLTIGTIQRDTICIFWKTQEKSGRIEERYNMKDVNNNLTE